MIGFRSRWKRPRTAAEWFAARRGGSDPELDRQFRAWLAQCASHGEEYALCEITWEVSGEAAHQVPEPRRLPNAVAALHWRAATLVAAATAVSLVVWFWPQQTHSWATAPGEQRTLLLEDGSRVTLNTRTRIAVRFTHREREVVLQVGEAYFDVARDASRPFTVRTSLGSAHAVGTRFNVYLADRRLVVTTEEGRVLVANAAKDSGVLVEAGRQAELRPGMPRVIVEPADLTATLNWLTRRLEVDDEPLESVLEDFSRYTMMSIRADTPTIAALRVSAVLHTGDVAALEATLKGAFGLILERRGSELVVTTPGTDETMSP
jgi:transmembrane sensor